jgi:hypothetical protein
VLLVFQVPLPAILTSELKAQWFGVVVLALVLAMQWFRKPSIPTS